MANQPAIMFYVGDWLKDPAVRSVSLAARGIWINMLCLMHNSARRGYLQHATGKPVSLEQIARMTGCSPDEASRLLQELTDSGVCSVDEHGTVYCRRMVRESRISQVRSEMISENTQLKRYLAKVEELWKVLEKLGIERRADCLLPSEWEVRRSVEDLRRVVPDELRVAIRQSLYHLGKCCEAIDALDLRGLEVEALADVY